MPRVKKGWSGSCDSGGEVCKSYQKKQVSCDGDA